MKDMIYKLFDNIDYETYSDMVGAGKYLTFSTFIAIISGIVNESLLWVFIAYLLQSGKLFLDSNSLFFRVKSVKEIRELYQEFLTRYNALNKMFGLNSPVEMMLLFSYLLKNGYISKDHCHKSEWPCDTQSLLLGSYCFTGKSYSEHSSELFSDILINSGLESTTLCVSKNQVLIEGSNIGNIYNESLEQLRFDVTDMISRGIITDENIYLRKKPLFDALYSIVIAHKGDISYYFDPSSAIIYRKLRVNGHDVLLSGIDACIPHVSWSYSKIYQDVGRNIKDARRMLEGMNASLEEELEARRKINEITSNNQDILEQFYRENAPLYEEVSQKLEKVRRKKS